MTKSILTILISFLFLSSFGQTIPDCFTRIKAEHERQVGALDLGKKFSVNLDSMKIDSADIGSLTLINKRIFQSLVGCQLPDTTFKSSDDKSFSISGLNTKFSIIHFNTIYCDDCTQLDDLLKLKNEYKESITIVLFYFDSKKDIQYLIDKYKSVFIFVPNSRYYYSKYTCGQGYPLNYLVDKNEIIKHGVSGSVPIYKELKPYFK